MHETTLTLATTANAWNGPAWILIVIVLSFILSSLSTLGVGMILHRNRQIDARLERGDGKFDDLAHEDAVLKVQQAIAKGDINKALYRDFVTRSDFVSHLDRVARLETTTIRTLASLETKVDSLLQSERKRKESENGKESDRAAG